MTDTMLSLIGTAFPLTERSAEEYAKANVAGMDFSVRCFDAAGLGNVSLMHGELPKGAPFVMAMDTIVINPFDKDMPLFSYDRIHAGGQEQLFLEMYNTTLNHVPDMSGLDEVNKEYSDLPDSPVASGWYDHLRYKQNVKKAGPEALSSRMDLYTEKYLTAYLRICAAAPSCDHEAKKNAASVYTEGLLTNGGASTDNFVKAKGIEFTQGLFRKVLFATG